MKNGVMLALLISVISTGNVMATPIKDVQAFADEWINTYVKSSTGNLLINPGELNTLLNLSYFSYKRSACTLAAQDYALKALNMNWHLLQNVTQTRLNPSHATPYKLELKAYNKLMKQAWQCEKEHEIVGSIYARMIDYLLDDTQNTTKELRKSIEALREQARAALADSLSVVKEYIESLIDECQKNRPEDNNESNTTTVKRSLFNYLLTLLPPLAAHSFVKIDSMGVQASEEGWKVLSEIERIHNLIWTALEQRRADFYAIMYRSLYAVAASSELDKEVFYISFDNDGPITANALDTLLPDPRKLTLFLK